MYMIRQQAAIDLTHKPEEGIFIKEQDIDDWLIANHEDDEATLSSTIADQQKYEATLKMVTLKPRYTVMQPESGRNQYQCALYPKGATGTSSIAPCGQRLRQDQPY